MGEEKKTKKNIMLRFAIIFLVLLVAFHVDMFIGPRIVASREKGYFGSYLEEEETRFEWGLSDLREAYYIAQWVVSEDQWSDLEKKMEADGWYQYRPDEGDEIVFERMNKTSCLLIPYVADEEVHMRRDRNDRIVLKISVIVNNKFMKDRMK
ncbi:MAG: hypothetical protein J5757_05110 [Lachnospiraceae bacterium]|nr:hypothetical protein [Lachnospiraceae bacterium]